MIAINLIATLVLMATLLGAFFCIGADRTIVDRLLGIQLMGTIGVAIVLMLGTFMKNPGIVDVALIFALLAAVTTVAFVRCRVTPH